MDFGKGTCELRSSKNGSKVCKVAASEGENCDLVEAERHPSPRLASINTFAYFTRDREASYDSTHVIHVHNYNLVLLLVFREAAEALRRPA